MNFDEALKIAIKKADDSGIVVHELDNPRQRRKFSKGVGIVRQLAGLPHGNRTKDVSGSTRGPSFPHM